MNRHTKRQVVATLIKSGRRDLARVVAHGRMVKAAALETLKKGAKLQLTVKYDDYYEGFVARPKVRLLEDPYELLPGRWRVTVKVVKDPDPRMLSKDRSGIRLIGERSGVGEVIDGVE